jgi:hypothetical protein
MYSPPIIPRPLVLKAPCYEDEGFLGYLARLVELNVAKVSAVMGAFHSLKSCVPVGRFRTAGMLPHGRAARSP